MAYQLLYSRLLDAQKAPHKDIECLGLNNIATGSEWNQRGFAVDLSTSLEQRQWQRVGAEALAMSILVYDLCSRISK